jgi:PAS domain S-box-containing protein
MANAEAQAQSVEQVLDRVSDAFFAVDSDWRFTYVNEQAEETLERSREDLVGDELWEHFAAAEGTTFEDEYRDAMATQESRSFQAYYPPLESWFRVHAHPSADGLSVYFEDVTDRRERDQKLARHEHVVDTLGEGVYVLDEDGCFAMVNDAYTEMLGYDREELLGEPATTVVSDEVHAEARDLEQRLREDDVETATQQARVERADGETLIAEATYSLTSVGDARERVAVVRDVTERERRRKQLEDHRDVLADHVDRTDLVQRINQAILRAPSRAAVRDAVCELLADSDFYEVAWIGRRAADGLERQAGAGVSSDDLEALVDAADAAGDAGPVEQALQREVIQVQQHIERDSADPRAAVFAERDYHSSISLPLAHDGEAFGVLTIDSEREHAFSGTERDLLGGLAETVAYALQTVETRQRYRSVVDDVLDTSVTAGIVVYDDAGHVEWLNEQAERFFDVAREDVSGLDAPDFLREHLQPAFETPVAATEEWLAETTTDPVEYHLAGDEDASDRYLERRCSDIDSGLYAGGSVALYYDITSRKESERQLAQSERRRSTLLQNLPGMAYSCRDADGWPMEFVSDGCAALTGYDAATIESGDVSYGEDVIHPEDQRSVREDVAEATATDDPFEITYRIRTADDETRWVWEQGREVETLDGETRLEGFVSDVTERRRQRVELERQHELTETMFGTSPIAILAVEPDGTLARANEQALEVLGVDADSGQASDYSVGDVPIHDEDGEVIQDNDRPVYRTLEDGEAVTDETIGVRTESGDMRWYSFRSAPVVDDDGEVTMAIVTGDDITDTKRRQAELARLNHVNSVIRRLNATIAESSDRQTVRETVCTDLAAESEYDAAWYSEVDLAADEIVPETVAGIDVDLDDVRIPVEGTVCGDAVTAGRVTVDALPASHPFADAVGQGTGGEDPTLAAVPISHSGTRHGLLCLASTDQRAFTREIRDLFGELGRTIGHALTAIMRKEGLLSDRATRLEFRLRDTLPDPVDVDDDVALTIENTVALDDETVLQYLTVAPDDADDVTALLEADAAVERVRRIDSDADAADTDGVRFEVKRPEPPLMAALTDFGGRIVSVAIEDGDYHVVTELPHSVAVRDVVERVTEVHPAADLEAQRSVTGEARSAAQTREDVLDALTDRQLTVLETAHRAGYFEWPRATTGEEVAETLDLSPSTFSQHLRAGERKTFTGLFERPD